MTTWSRVLVGLGIALVVAAGSVALVGLRAAAILEGNREELMAAVSRFVGWPIEAESLEGSWVPPAVVARGVRVPDVSPLGPGDLLTADEAHFEFDVLPLLRGRLVVSEVRLHAPVLRVVRGSDGGWNLTRPVSAEPEEVKTRSGERFAPRVTVGTVRVRNGRILYRDRGVPGIGEVEVKAVNLRLRHGDKGTVVDWNSQMLGGPPENVSGRLRVPPSGEGASSALLEVEASAIEAARLPQIVGVLRGRIPFGAVLGGPLSSRASVELLGAWPPAAAVIELEVDATEATLRAASGWLEKPADAALLASGTLRASGEELTLERLLLKLDDCELRAEADPIDGSPGVAPGPGTGAPQAAQPASQATSQPPLRVTSTGLTARALARWMPALADYRPSGALTLVARIAPAGGAVGSDLRVTSEELAADLSGEATTASRAVLHGLVSEDGRRLLGSFRLDDVRYADAHAAVVEVAVGGALGGSMAAKLTVTRASIRGAPMERLVIEGDVSADRVEVRSANADALGGVIRAQGRARRRDDGGFEVEATPEWDQLDARGLLVALGEAGRASGSLHGKARLGTVVGSGGRTLSSLSGDVEASLRDGEIVDLNLAAATLENLRGVPKLRESLERRAQERAPDLLATTSRISLLELHGRFGSEALVVSDLTLESLAYALAGKGRIGFDGSVEIDGALTLAPAATQALVADGGVAQLLVGSNGQVQIPVAVRGEYPRLSSAPTSEFLSRLMARAIAPGSDDAGGWLDRLLRRRPSGGGATDGAR